MQYQYTEISPNIHKIILDKIVSDYDYHQLMGDIKDTLELNQRVSFIVDLSQLTFMNSSGLNFLLQLLTKSRNQNGDTVIINISEQIINLLVITKIKSLFSLFDSETEAVEYLAKLHTSLA